MIKKKRSLSLAILFLIQSVMASSILSFESSPLNPPTAPVLYEGAIADPVATFQVLPSLKEILSGCKIKPREIYSFSEVNRSI